jgi:twitching motility protein PilT
MPLLKKPTEETRVSALKRLENILKRATEKKASDLHLKAGLPPVVRVNGALYYLGEDATATPAALTEPFLVDVASSLMNERQLDRYESGEEIDLGYELPGFGRFRINICQQRSKPRLVARYIPDQIATLEELGLPEVLGELVRAQRGLILVTGATGSGKSTTLAAMIDRITRTRSCHIVTIEDPIEFVFRDRKSIVTQREVGMDTKSFSSALKYALRQDPDVILVGEMRDEETILMALNAAETGHLVLSTLHTNDATETVNRILGSVSGDIQASVRVQLANVLVGVVAQRLVKRKENKGRIAAQEILIANQRVREMIIDPARTPDLPKVLEESGSLGMQSFDEALMRLFSQGLIDSSEAMKHCSNRADFELRLKGVVGGVASPQVAAGATHEEGAPQVEIEGFADGVLQRRRPG